MHATPLQNMNNETTKAGRACMDPLCEQIKERKVAEKLASLAQMKIKSVFIFRLGEGRAWEWG